MYTRIIKDQHLCNGTKGRRIGQRVGSSCITHSMIASVDSQRVVDLKCQSELSSVGAKIKGPLYCTRLHHSSLGRIEYLENWLSAAKATLGGGWELKALSQKHSQQLRKQILPIRLVHK